jgi:hypothetical protein
VVANHVKEILRLREHCPVAFTSATTHPLFFLNVSNATFSPFQLRRKAETRSV